MADSQLLTFERSWHDLTVPTPVPRDEQGSITCAKSELSSCEYNRLSQWGQILSVEREVWQLARRFPHKEVYWGVTGGAVYGCRVGLKDMIMNNNTKIFCHR